METSFRMTALELVLRERDAIAVLPSTVYAIRRFAQVPLSKRFQYATANTSDDAAVDAANVAALEHFLLCHAEDLRFEALERDRDRDRDTNASSNDESDYDCWLEHVSITTKRTLPPRVLTYGARVGSVAIVQWALSTRPQRSSILAGLTQAVVSERMTVVQLLYPFVPDFSVNDQQDLVTIAAKHGCVVAIEWLFAQRSWSQVGLSFTAARVAAAAGQLTVVQWIYATFPTSISWAVLQDAAISSQQRVLDWFVNQRIAISHFWLMWATKQVLFSRKFDAVTWIHRQYPRCVFTLSDIDEYCERREDVSAVRDLITTFPKRYNAHGLAFGATYGDLELVKAHTDGRRVKHRELKRAMHRAAGRGHAAVIKYLYECSNGECLPTTVLWRALRCGHVDIVIWAFEHKPALCTRERLEEMHEASVRQLPSNADDDLVQVTQWLDAQLMRLTLCREVEQARRTGST